MKKGFTLAEVLITLGILGVIAVLTMSVLNNNTGNAKIGPTLAKAVTTLELANQNMLNATDSVTINASPAGVKDKYIEVMSDYMHITPFVDPGTTETKDKYSNMLKNYKGEAYIKGSSLGIAAAHLLMAVAGGKNSGITKDGVLYIVAPITTNSEIDYNAPHKSFSSLVLIDINGKKGANQIGKDVFAFQMMQDGTLNPYGSRQWVTQKEGSFKTQIGGSYEDYNWENGAKDKCNKDEVTSGWTCAGSIYENNLKVIYQ